MRYHSHHYNSSTENISTTFFLNIFFTIITVIGGFYKNNLAITSDAIHDLGASTNEFLIEYVSLKK